MILPESVKIGELVKAFYIKLGIDDKKYLLLLNSKKLSQDNNISLESIMDNIRITIYSAITYLEGQWFMFLGKK